MSFQLHHITALKGLTALTATWENHSHFSLSWFRYLKKGTVYPSCRLSEPVTVIERLFLTINREHFHALHYSRVQTCAYVMWNFDMTGGTVCHILFLTPQQVMPCDRTELEHASAFTEASLEFITNSPSAWLTASPLSIERLQKKRCCLSLPSMQLSCQHRDLCTDLCLLNLYRTQ